MLAMIVGLKSCGSLTLRKDVRTTTSGEALKRSFFWAGPSGKTAYWIIAVTVAATFAPPSGDGSFACLHYNIRFDVVRLAVKSQPGGRRLSSGSGALYHLETTPNTFKAAQLGQRIHLLSCTRSSVDVSTTSTLAIYTRLAFS